MSRVAKSKRGKAKGAAHDRTSAHALDLANYVPAYLTFLANKLSSGASALYRAQFGVGIVDWRIMALLAIEPWIAAGRIGEVIGLDKAAISRSIAFMQREGLVESRYQDNNRRRQFIALTAAGLALHDRIAVVALERERKLLAGFTPQERRMAIDLLARMHARVSDLAE